MINILFVDDEPNILHGLKRMLRSMRHEWKMSFATGGTEALRMMAEKPFDIIVSDMRMPNMDGATLLTTIKEKYPQTVRLILSGYSEKDMIMRSVNTAHQYLAKPCDPDNLQSTVNRAFALRELLTDKNLQKLVSQMHSVPSIPALYDQLIKELEKDDPDLKTIGEIIQQDIGMTVKMLQIVNSAFFGLRREITDVTDTIKILGIEMIKSLTFRLAVFSKFETTAKLTDEITSVWQHSVRVGWLAKTIAAERDLEIASDSFTAGILHNIGKIVLAVSMPEKYEEIKNLPETENPAKHDPEKQTFQTIHSAVGAYLLGLWGLPEKIVEAVAFHRCPREYQSDSFSPLTAVHIADVICRNAETDLTDNLEKFFDVDHLEKTGVTDRIAFWQRKFSEREKLSKNII